MTDDANETTLSIVEHVEGEGNSLDVVRCTMRLRIRGKKISRVDLHAPS